MTEKRLWARISAGHTDKKTKRLRVRKRESLSPLSPYSPSTSVSLRLLLLFILLYGRSRAFSPGRALLDLLRPGVPGFLCPPPHPVSSQNFSTARALVLRLFFFPRFPSAPSVSSTIQAGDFAGRCGFSSRTSFRLRLLQAFSKRFKRFDFADKRKPPDTLSGAWTRNPIPNA
jgi:hypothetical protein